MRSMSAMPGMPGMPCMLARTRTSLLWSNSGVWQEMLVSSRFELGPKVLFLARLWCLCHPTQFKGQPSPQSFLYSPCSLLSFPLSAVDCKSSGLSKPLRPNSSIARFDRAVFSGPRQCKPDSRDGGERDGTKMKLNPC